MGGWEGRRGHALAAPLEPARVLVGVCPRDRERERLVDRECVGDGVVVFTCVHARKYVYAYGAPCNATGDSDMETSKENKPTDKQTHSKKT